MSLALLPWWLLLAWLANGVARRRSLAQRPPNPWEPRPRSDPAAAPTAADKLQARPEPYLLPLAPTPTPTPPVPVPVPVPPTLTPSPRVAGAAAGGGAIAGDRGRRRLLV